MGSAGEEEAARRAETAARYAEERVLARSTRLAELVGAVDEWVTSGEIAGTPFQFVIPTGIRATDTANLQAAINAMAGVGEVLIRGRYYTNAPLVFPSGAKLRGLGRVGDTVIDVAVTGDQLSDCAFRPADVLTAGSTTIDAANLVGTRTLSLTGLGGGATTTALFVQPAVGASVTASVATAGFLAGQRVFVAGGGTYSLAIVNGTTATLTRLGGHPGDAATGATVASGAIVMGAVIIARDDVSGGVGSGAGFGVGIYLVRGVSGVGPYTVTTDRPVLYPYGAGDLVQVFEEQIHGVSIANLEITGTSESRIIEFIQMRDSEMRDIYLHDYTTGVPGGGGAPSDLSVSFDTGSYNCWMRRVVIDGGGTQPGIGFESNEASGADNCVVRRTTPFGFRVNNGGPLTLDNCIATGCGDGVHANPETTGRGPLNLHIVGGEYENNGVGINLISCVDSTLTGVRARNNELNLCVDYGTATVTGGSFGSDDTEATHSGAASRTQYGIRLRLGAAVKLHGIDTSNARTGMHVYDGSVAHVFGWKHRGHVGANIGNQEAMLATQDSSRVWAQGLDFAILTGYRGVSAGGTSVVRISGSRIETIGDPAWNGIAAIGGTAAVSDTEFVGFNNDTVSASGATGQVITGDGVTFSAGAFVNLTDGSKANYGSVTLAGTTPVVVSLPASLGVVAGQDHRITATLKTVGGTQGVAPTVVAGTNQFTITGKAADTSVYAWRVI